MLGGSSLERKVCLLYPRCCHFKKNSASKVTICQLSYVVTSKLLATHFYFLSLKYGVRMRKKNTQESEDEWWARLDKRIEG